VLEGRDGCRDEASFLGWCKQVLVNDIRDMHRRQTFKSGSGDRESARTRELYIEELDSVPEDAYETPGEERRRDESSGVPEQALREPMLRALVWALQECLEKERRVRVIVELFLNSKPLAQVAEELGISARNTQIIKQRALERLRECPEMKELYADWTA
jgi:RNA polymerase sigma factor (sigma-70 family)